MAREKGKPLSDLIVYDPYYCQGSMVGYLNSIGVQQVINRNSDFYADIENNTVPGNGMTKLHH